ncbi:siderophore-interacting protein [Arsenicitalea aurantiaca]|uniref:Siderophore-interacting protein n=1 Tax=Arsenicitalea aurantiaca TaxID=1783274 RepID=A0A433X3I2_9HYPH|nr:siderophore-interacting protein [Arsenicitalea aurantiaca]RUT28620.1 siderophore-interacting protein [Arsenicitalea aurantiaca]
MPHEFKRLRHDTKIRTLEVVGLTHVTPKMLRVTLGGSELAGFTSPGYGDHVKIFFSPDPDAPVLPVLGPDGLAFPADRPRPEMRDYTPRRFDPEALTLDIDFVLHGDGPASGWAAQAQIGQTLVIGGPRGSLIVPDDFDWYLLAGDETALPAMSRRLEELPAGKPVLALLEVAGPEEEQPIVTRADATIHWLHRNGVAAGMSDLLLRRLEATPLPQGEGYAFLAGEAGMSRALRAHLVDRCGFEDAHIKAAGYWVLGEADAHEPH